MTHRTVPLAVLALATLILLGLISCGVPGDDGHTYLALDWTSAPQALYFPAFPDIVYAGDYVEHAAGNYEGEYIAWDGSYWNADYWIAVEEGGEAPLFGAGDNGDDYYLSMWLYSFGPSIYTDDIVVKSVSAGVDVSSQRSLDQNETVPEAILAARAWSVSEVPQLVTGTYASGSYTVTVIAEGYRRSISTSEQASR